MKLLFFKWWFQIRQVCHVFICIFQAALAVWITILRFMGDLPEPKYITSQPESKVTEVSSLWLQQTWNSSSISDNSLIGKYPFVNNNNNNLSIDWRREKKKLKTGLRSNLRSPCISRSPNNLPKFSVTLYLLQSWPVYSGHPVYSCHPVYNGHLAFSQGDRCTRVWSHFVKVHWRMRTKLPWYRTKKKPPQKNTHHLSTYFTYRSGGDGCH